MPFTVAKSVSPFLLALMLASTSAFADEVKWSGTVKASVFDCKLVNISKIVVSGAVILQHPEDTDPLTAPKTITIVCPNIEFETGSSLNSISSLDIRIAEVSAGPIKIINTRGVKGKDASAVDDPNGKWAVRKMTDGGPGAGGRHGDNADGCLDIPSHGSGPGDRGGDGVQGESGLNYAAPPGDPGGPGGMAGNLVFVTRSFAEGSTLDMQADGGEGGRGGRGGRGADGGVGGKGGAGGQGGDASGCHTASRGGDGGTGGRGGDGGNGGQGGSGGPGGNGGQINQIKEAGGYNPPATFSVRGGLGGFGGLGGEKGIGGQGGEGGDFGFGGSGDCGFLGCGIKVDPKGPGGTGNAGLRGHRGEDGHEGPLGTTGKPGEFGSVGHGFAGNATQDQIDKLLKYAY